MSQPRAPASTSDPAAEQTGSDVHLLVRSAAFEVSSEVACGRLAPLSIYLEFADGISRFSVCHTEQEDPEIYGLLRQAIRLTRCLRVAAISVETVLKPSGAAVASPLRPREQVPEGWIGFMGLSHESPGRPAEFFWSPIRGANGRAVVEMDRLRHVSDPPRRLGPIFASDGTRPLFRYDFNEAAEQLAHVISGLPRRPMLTVAALTANELAN